MLWDYSKYALQTIILNNFEAFMLKDALECFEKFNQVSQPNPKSPPPKAPP
jgi:hypothetical protein